MAFDLGIFLKVSGDMIKDEFGKIQKSVGTVDLKKTVDDVKNKGKDTVEFIKNKTDEAVQAISDKTTTQVVKGEFLDAKGAMQLMYLMSAADGNITPDELLRFKIACREIDVDYLNHETSIMEECSSLVSSLDASDFDDSLHDCARDIINASYHKKGATVPVKLLLWNLLVMAFSDDEFSESENSFIRYISRHLNIDKSIIPEMENSLRALIAVEAETEWLKSVDRPYREVEMQLNELSDRKSAIMQGINMLIAE